MKLDSASFKFENKGSSTHNSTTNALQQHVFRYMKTTSTHGTTCLEEQRTELEDNMKLHQK